MEETIKDVAQETVNAVAEGVKDTLEENLPDVVNVVKMEPGIGLGKAALVMTACGAIGSAAGLLIAKGIKYIKRKRRKYGTPEHKTDEIEQDAPDEKIEEPVEDSEEE